MRVSIENLAKRQIIGINKYSGVKMNNLKRFLIILSVAVNILIALPAILFLIKSEAVQYDLYSIFQKRLGKPEIVFIGDSITRKGNIWAYRIGEYTFNVWNYGHGGMTTRQIEYYAKKAAKDSDTKFAFVMAGTNDPVKTTTGAEKTFEDYKVILKILRKAGITPIIQFTLYRENEKEPFFFDRLNELLSDYANANNIRTINLNPIIAPNKSLLPEYSKDGVHLTEAAYDIWAKEIKKVMNDLNYDAPQK